jgi:hypothetical protein
VTVVFRVFFISVNGVGSQALALYAFCMEYGFDFAAGVMDIPLVSQLYIKNDKKAVPEVHMMNELKSKIHDEVNGIDYILVADYYIPITELPEDDDRLIVK